MLAGMALLSACAGPADPGLVSVWPDGKGSAGPDRGSLVAEARPRDAGARRDPIDLLPVARFTSGAGVDALSRCIGERWARLSAFAPGQVTLHPGLRGLIVDVKTTRDPLARAYVEIYPLQGVTHVDYFVRSFVSDPDEDLRRRALQSCF
ncbi:MAG: hypothetical protein ACRYHA_03715 [Janthinobacterium lividum]